MNQLQIDEGVHFGIEKGLFAICSSGLRLLDRLVVVRVVEKVRLEVIRAIYRVSHDVCHLECT